jgi:hypothetical protein
MNASCFSFRACSTGPDLSLIVRLDGEEKYHFTDLPQDPQDIVMEFNDEIEVDHIVEIEMQGKLPEQTQLDADGNIVGDRVIEISDFTIDDITLGHLFTEVSQYHHDHNGTSEPVENQFYGTMGCNGVIRFRFSSPVYLWLLGHM